MPDETRHESEDLEDYEDLDSSDTLDAPPGDDPLDRGIIPPERWSAGMRFGTTTEEEEAGESLDQLLAEEEPETDPYAGDDDEDLLNEVGGDENAGDEDVDGLLLDDGPDPRAGRLTEDDGLEPYSPADGDLTARDVGVDAGAATAEEAAVHVVEDDDNDIRSE
jgi:Family of unknown function (DUF5709)